MHEQAVMSKHLVAELGTAVIGIADVHRNTALHYLTDAFCTNLELISWLRAGPGGEDAWQSAANIHGHTPDPFDENEEHCAQNQCGYHYCGALWQGYPHGHLGDGAFRHPSGRPRGRGRTMRAINGRWTYQ